MFFYVYLQPEVFDEALNDGEDASQSLSSILGGFCQNCFVAVFEDDRWATSVKEIIEKHPATMARKYIKSMLVKLKKRNRFLFTLTPDYEGVVSDLDRVFQQAPESLLDLLLVTALESQRVPPAGIELVTRRAYMNSTLEPVRADLAVYGKTCVPGDLDEAQFMEFHFQKALMHASEINICDRVCGRNNFADNFRYTTRKLLVWLGSILAEPDRCTIRFHMGRPDGQGDQYILNELRSIKNGPLSATNIEVCFYDESLPDPHLPHQRFILSDQMALDVDRGLDFLDRHTRKCRDTHISYQRPGDVSRILAGCSSGCVASHTV